MRLGSLFSGYGGLDMAIESVLGTTTAWVSDIDPGACKILAHRYPDVPNLGDIAAVDWDQVEPVDVLTGGFPCQDVSHAGRRAGLAPGSRSGLWSAMAGAIDKLRPALVVAENVRGLLSADGHGEVEPCPWCVGEAGDGEPPLRALGTVLGDLADLGYDAAWCGLRAADVGAAHGRFRVFVVAWPVQDPDSPARSQRWLPAPRQAQERGARPDPGGRGRAPAADLIPTTLASDAGPRGGTTGFGLRDWSRNLPTPTSRDWKGHNQRGDTSSLTGALLPTPAAANPNDGEGLVTWEARRERIKAQGVNGNGFGTPLAIAVQQDRWAEYGPAIASWEAILHRPAPSPTELSAKGNPRLAPSFVEWLMGLPAGHVTAVPDLTRNEQLKALGNGVVPQQAAAGVAWLLHQVAAANTAA